MTSYYALAAGHNNTGGLTLIQNLMSFEGEPFAVPKIYGTYNPGTFRIRGDGSLYTAGFGSMSLDFGFITWEKDFYLRATFASGGYSGPVTIKTRTDDPLVWPVFNARAIFPKLIDLRTGFGIFEGDTYKVRFVRMVAL